VVLTSTGILIFILNPRHLSKEELKTDYTAACFGREKYPLWRKLLGQIITRPDFWSRRYDKRVVKTEKPLITRGYLQERIFVISNHPPREILNRAKTAFASAAVSMLLSTNGFMIVPWQGGRPGDVLARSWIEGTNIFIVVAPPESMGEWELVVKMADGPR
jgi:hypothetical protein